MRILVVSQLLLFALLPSMGLSFSLSLSLSLLLSGSQRVLRSVFLIFDSLESP